MGSVSITAKAACSSSASFSWGSVTGVDYARRSYNQGVVYRISVSGECTALYLNVGFMANSTGYDCTVSAYLYGSDPTTSGSKQPVGGYITSQSIGARLSLSGNLSTGDRMCNFSLSGLNLSSGTYYIWCCETGGSPFAIQIYTGGGGYNLDSVNISGSFSPDPPPVTTYTVSVIPDAGISSVSGTGTYYGGTTCTLSVQISPGYVFDGWYQGTSQTPLSTATAIQFTVLGNYEFYAKTKPAAQIIVSYDEMTISSATGSGSYVIGSSCTVSATLKTETDEYRYEFIGWQEGTDIVSTDLQYTFTVTGLRVLYALGRMIAKSPGGVWIYTGSEFEHHTGTINTEDSNIKVIPWIYHDSEWIKCK